MGFATGPDFNAGRHGWLYDNFTRQPWWLSLILGIGVFTIYSVLQGLFGLVAYAIFYGSVADLRAPEGAASSDFAKATMMALLPSALLGAGLAWLAGLFAARGGPRGIPLQLPKLGIAGWAFVVGGFLLAMYAINLAVFVGLGIDPSTYSPSNQGVENDTSSAGFVEKAIADLSDEPLPFALTVPGVAFAVPLLEELVFRGALFSALLQTPLGRVGTVVVTAALWAVNHAFGAPWLFVAIIFFMGLLLGFLLLRFGSLWVTVACHAAWNALSSLTIYSVAGSQ